MRPPLFLLAPPRSYTSLINAMMGQHPELYGLPELNLFSYNNLLELLQPDLRDQLITQNSTHGILRAVAEIFTGEQTTRTIEFAEHWCAARQELSVGDVFNDIRKQIHPLIPMDKSPLLITDVKALNRIIDACPETLFIHLTRHPIKQGESILSYLDSALLQSINSLDYLEDKVIFEPQIAWHDLNVNILNFLETRVPKEQQMRLCGEAVMENPEEELSKVCRWIGVRDDAEAIDAMMHPERSPYANVGPVNALFGNDMNFLRGSKFKKHKPDMPSLDTPLPWREDGKCLRPEVIEMARDFGYK